MWCFFWDDPQAGWVDSLKSAGVRVWIQVGSPDEAQNALAMGADALIVQGSEAGGHNRAVAALFSLLPVIVDQSPVPVIASGGIADGRGVAAALALGAEAVWVGTRLVASVEANSHAGYKQRIVEAGVGDTERHSIFGPQFPDAPVRGIRNRIVREWSGRDNPPPYKGLDPASLPIIGELDLDGAKIPMTRFMGFPPTANSTGDLEEMGLLAGESVGLVHELKPAGEIVRSMMAEAGNIIRDRLASVVAGPVTKILS